ncbi:restriction endonuclease [Paenibacillus medicaginis]|uniref:Restriction endonuclease n=1 Tax=Paenibacillus medicaginis TaxID=1470560 RepID=A0ABV5C120_9BACL
MARRRRKSKARQAEEFIQGIVGLSMLIGFFLTFSLAKNITAAFVMAIVVFVICTLILASRRAAHKEKLRRSGIAEVDKMDGFQFERYLSYLFTSQGYNARVTKASGDFGADLILSKNGTKIVVQAKRYSKNVGIKAVQEAQAAIAHYRASEAWVVTNSDFTESAYQLAKSNKVKLINRNQLVEMMLQMKHKKVPNRKTG